MKVKATKHHDADRCCRLRHGHIENTCEVMQAMIAERGDDQFSDEGMKILGVEGRKTPILI